MKKINYILFILVLQLIFAVEDNSINNSNSTNCFGNCYEPIANAGPTQTYYNGANATLDGSGSFDPEGQSLYYNWLFPDGIILNNSDQIELKEVS